MSNQTINTSSLGQLVDSVDRNFLVAKANPLLNTMLNSGFVRKETMGTSSGLSRIFAQTPVKTPYFGSGAEGNPAEQAIVQYGYEKQLLATKHDLAVSITYEMRKGGKNQEIISQLTNIAEGGFAEIDLHLTHRAFTFAWSTSFSDARGAVYDNTCGDGLAVISTSHPLTGSATTWSNQVPNNGAFSKGLLSLARQLGNENTYDNLGNKMAVEYDTIVTTDFEPTVVQVKELLNATSNIDSANANTYNVYGSGSYKHVINRRIATRVIGKSIGADTTKNGYWFLIASAMKPVVYGEVEGPTVTSPREGNNGEDASTGSWSFYGRALWGACIPSSMGMIGSKGDGSV